LDNPPDPNHPSLEFNSHERQIFFACLSLFCITNPLLPVSRQYPPAQRSKGHLLDHTFKIRPHSSNLNEAMVLNTLIALLTPVQPSTHDRFSYSASSRDNSLTYTHHETMITPSSALFHTVTGTSPIKSLHTHTRLIMAAVTIHNLLATILSRYRQHSKMSEQL